MKREQLAVTWKIASACLLTGSHPQKGRRSGGGALWNATQQPGERPGVSDPRGPPCPVEERRVPSAWRNSEDESHSHEFRVILT